MPVSSSNHQIGVIIALMLLGQIASVQAQPSAITPQDVSRFRQLTTFSWDWSESDAFNFRERIELTVTVERLVIPERGNAELLFTLTERQRTAADMKLRPLQRYHATLQSADEIKRLAVRASDLPNGFEAHLIGWPATARNVTPSVMLVDEIVLPQTGFTLKLHDHDRMRRHRTDSDPESSRDS